MLATMPPAPPPALVVVHASLKYSAPADVTARYVARVCIPADLCTTTEAQQPHIRAEVRQLLPATYRVRRWGQFMVVWRPAVLRFEQARRWVLSHTPRLARWRQFHAVRVLFRWRPAHRQLRVVDGHAISAVQDGDAWRTPWQAHVRAARAGLAELGARLHRWQRLTTVVDLDANLDEHRQVWRARLDRILHAASIWDVSRPAAGTHAGRRLIDVAHLDRLRRLWARLGPLPPPCIDHRSIIYEVQP